MRPDQTESVARPLPRRERAGSPNIESATSWQEIKGRFVDDPAGATASAEQLVRNAAQQRIRAIEQEAEALCNRRDDDESSTEDMRTRLIRYQEYCERVG